MNYSVFISYSTKDLGIVTYVKNLLENYSIKVYVAEYTAPPGVDLTNHIKDSINSCDLFILLWSSNSKKSEWVTQEIALANANNKPIIPVVLEPNLELPVFIKNLKYLEAYTNPQQAFEYLRRYVYEAADKKSRVDGLVMLGLGTAFLYLLTSGK
jgi:hypothetical protein